MEAVGERQWCLHQALKWPCGILDVFRLWTPYTPKSDTWLTWTLPRLMLLLLAGCAAAECCLSIIEAVHILAGTNTTGRFSSSLIVSIFAIVPHNFLSLRGVMTLCLMVVGQAGKQRLQDSAEQLVRSCILISDRPKLYRKWSRQSRALTVYCFVAFFSIYAINWVHGMELLRLGLSDGYQINPLPVRIPLICAILLQFLLIGIPYYLSQLVLVNMIIFAVILRDAVVTVNDRLERIHDMLFMLRYSEGSAGEVSAILEEIYHLMDDRARQFEFIQLWNKEFGSFLLIFYTADMSVAAGMLTVVLTNSEPTQIAMVAKLTGAVVMVSFVTALYLPFMNASEKAASTGATLYKLEVTSRHLASTSNIKDSEKLQLVLMDFRDAIASCPLHFHGGEFFHVTRQMLIRTCTLLLSFGFILLEFYKRLRRHEAQRNPLEIRLEGGTSSHRND